MLQDLDKIGLDFVDSSDDCVRIIEIILFMEKSIKEFQGRRPENIFRGVTIILRMRKSLLCFFSWPSRPPIDMA